LSERGVFVFSVFSTRTDSWRTAVVARSLVAENHTSLTRGETKLNEAQCCRTENNIEGAGTHIMLRKIDHFHEFLF